MMRPASYTGGVLDSSANEQAQLHDKIRGVGFLTEAQRKANLAKIVRPFTSSTIAPAAAVTAGGAHRRTGSHKSSARPSSASGRPSTASSSVKKSSASTSASMHVSATARPSLAGGGGASAPHSAMPPQPQAPAWIGSGIHEPSRPNAPSQQTAAERAAAHRPPSASRSATAVGQQQPQQPRVAKSHKVVTRRYAKPDATSPRSLDEAHTQVSIERHARPLVIRPAAAPAAYGSAKKRSQSQAQTASRWEGLPPAVVKFVPIGHVVGLSRNGEDVTDEVLRASSNGGRYTQAYRQQLELAQQQQQHEEDEEQDEQNHQPQQSASAPPISASGALATPFYDGLNHNPQPYSTQFQQSPPQPSSSPADSLATEPPSASPVLSVQTSSAAHDEMPIVAVFSPGGTSTALLASPSPARNGQPQQHGFNEQTVGASPARGRAAMSNSTLSSPAHRAEQERRRLEADHEKQMKNYLSPSSRATAKRSPAAKRTTSAGTQFTPNPHGRNQHDSPTKEMSQSSSTSSLFYEPRFERPADLPPVPVAHVQPTLLYPPPAADPHRQLAAALRGPAMKYAVTGPAPLEDDTPLSPMHVSLPASEAVESTRSEVSNSLAAVVAERAASRARLQQEEKAKWDEKWSKVKQATQAAAVSAARNLYSPLSSPSSANAAAAHRTEQQQQQPSGTHSDAARTLHFEPAIDVSSVVPNLRSPGSAGSAHALQPAVVAGGRTTDPVVVSHARPQQGSQQQATGAAGSNVIFSASSSSSSAAAAASSSGAAVSAASSSSFPPTRRFVVGSTNPSKLQAVRDVVVRVFGAVSGGSMSNGASAAAAPLPNSTVHPRSIAAASGLRPAEVVGVSVPSGVSDQPMSASDTLAGSIARAKAALAADPLAEYGVGVEGGAECLEGRWYECGWVAIVDRAGRLGTGSSARFQLADPIVSELLGGHTELAEIVDRLSGQSDVRSNSGFMGMITNDILKRADAYRHGVLFALAPFISSPVYW